MAPTELIGIFLVCIGSSAVEDKTGKLWEPIEWRFENPSCEGNPFDLMAEATFRHENEKETIRANLFHTGDKNWILRFTGTLKGKWTFTTKSTDSDLDGKTGEVQIEPNPGVAGFMVAY